MFLPRAWRWYKRNYLRKKLMTAFILSPVLPVASEIVARYV